MCVETLQWVDTIDKSWVIRKKPDNLDWEQFDELRKEFPILITEDKNMISFRLQKGPIKEVGINGCQVNALIKTAEIIISKLNDQFPCNENNFAIRSLQDAIFWLEYRKKDREQRGVEGKNEL